MEPRVDDREVEEVEEEDVDGGMTGLELERGEMTGGRGLLDAN